jgi:Kef-type K+ transport system membrane component KefB
MNKYEQRAEQQRSSAMRSGVMMGTAGVALLAVVLLIIGLNSSAPQAFFSRAAVGLAVLLLVLRQLGRRFRGKAARAAQPDPLSRLDLDN